MMNLLPDNYMYKTTLVKWKSGYAGYIKHTPLTGYKSKTVSDTILCFARWWGKDSIQDLKPDFGHALEWWFEYEQPLSLLESEEKRLRHNVIERIKFTHWAINPELEYFQLTESILKKLNEDIMFLCIEAAHSIIRNDVPLTTPITNSNIGFI